MNPRGIRSNNFRISLRNATGIGRQQKGSLLDI